MHGPSHLAEIVLLLATAVGLVPLFRRLGLSPILGYLAAGVAIGPHGFALIAEVEQVQAFAQFGVVFLLFVIGLELSFSRLAKMRGPVLGVGLAQVTLTGLALTGLGLWAGLPVAAAVVVGGGLALSSTAVVLELLQDGAEKNSQTGRLSLATLILQDLAVIPLLVLVPLLASGEEGSILAALGEASFKAIVTLLLIVLVGRRLLKPLFRFIAAHKQHELFLAATLFVVLGLAWVSELAGMSPALGAFVGGLLVAETEFKPQVEADILPFKSLFLGLFFTAVGMNINVGLVEAHAVEIIGLASALMAVKALIVLALARAFGFPRATAAHSALLLSQGGEFGFVLLGLAVTAGVIEPGLSELLIAAIAFTMAMTPLLHMLGRHLVEIMEAREPLRPLPMREIMDVRDHVIIAGFGRVGRVVAKLLEAERVPYVGLDIDATNVASLREQGLPVYYGDAGRGIVLKAAGIGRAQAIVISHTDARHCQLAISAIRKLQPDIPIIVRARNIDQVFAFERAGATLAVAEMLETSLQLGGALLKSLGVSEPEVSRVVQAFRAEDYALTRGAGTEPTPSAPPESPPSV